MARTVTLARSEDIPDGQARSFEVGRRRIGIYNCRGTFHAIDDVCTHAFALLSEGSVDRFSCSVECPLHSAEFDLATGAVLTPPATDPVTVFPVSVVDGEIRVELPD